jgi:hypothetical protein
MKSLLYLHKETIATHEIKRDVDFLLDLHAKEAVKNKRWQSYLKEQENILGDENAHTHSVFLEFLAYKESAIEGLSERQTLMMMWIARFHGLGNIVQDRDYIFNKLDSVYVKSMMENVLSIAIDRKNVTNDEFDYVSFFDSLKRRAHLSVALKQLEKKAIVDWNFLVADVFAEHMDSLFEAGKTYRSVKVFLQKNGKMINHGLEHTFTSKYVRDIPLIRIDAMKKGWNEHLLNLNV